MIAVGDRKANDDVFLRCIAMKQSIKSSHQYHKKRGAFLPTQLFERCRDPKLVILWLPLLPGRSEPKVSDDRLAAPRSEHRYQAGFSSRKVVTLAPRRLPAGVETGRSQRIGREEGEV